MEGGHGALPPFFADSDPDVVAEGRKHPSEIVQCLLWCYVMDSRLVNSSNVFLELLLLIDSSSFRARSE